MSQKPNVSHNNFHVLLLMKRSCNIVAIDRKIFSYMDHLFPITSPQEMNDLNNTYINRCKTFNFFKEISRCHL